MRKNIWNKCDVCGKFIPFSDFGAFARRELITPDSDFSKEKYETLCRKCILKEIFL